MKLFNFRSKYEHGGDRITIPGLLINLPKIDSFQILELNEKLDEPQHTNKSGYVVCIVLDGWAEARVNGKLHKLKKNQGILFEPGENHKIVKGQGKLLSISSEDYDTSLGTVWK